MGTGGTVATSGGDADNSYYQNVVLASTSNQSGYLSQLNAVNSGWGTGPMATVMTRVDGMCPIRNPTTAEIIQWAMLETIALASPVMPESGWPEATGGSNVT